MTHVFISYSRKNSKIVDQLAARLSADGFDVWLDREAIQGGNLWREAIVEAVDNAYAFLLVLSPASVASNNVRREVDLAEGSGKDIIPVLLARVNVPARLRYQLAGIQWIEYYRKPELKYAELVNVLQACRQKFPSIAASATREVEIVIGRIDTSKFGPNEQKKLLAFIARITHTPSANLKITRIRAGSVHAFVNMPADTAYRLKTAALNRNSDLINHGIHALRLTNDRHFVLVKTGRIAPLKSGRYRGSCLIGSAILTLTLVLAALIILFTSPLKSTLLPMGTLTTTKAIIPMPSSTVTSTFTDTFTPTPSQTNTPTNTYTPSQTYTPTATSSFTLTSTNTHTPTYTPNPMAEFEDPILTTIQFYCFPPPYPDSLIIVERVKDPSGVSSVILHFWLENKNTGQKRYESNGNMEFVGTANPYWQLEISIPYESMYDDIQTNYWLQFQFTATDNVGAITQSKEYRNRVTYRSCSYFG